MIIAHLMSGCEPILPNGQSELSNEVDSVLEKEEILPRQEIDGWDTDTTVYHTTTKPTKKTFIELNNQLKSCIFPPFFCTFVATIRKI